MGLDLKSSIALAMMAIVPATVAEPTRSLPPNSAFVLGKIQIGITTLAEAQNMLGHAVEFRTTQSDESPAHICYAANSSGKRIYVTLESGPMGGFERITSFSLSQARPDHTCGLFQTREHVLSTGNGVALGQSRHDFLSKYSLSFTSDGNRLNYTSQTRRSPTAKELADLKEAWPHEPSYQLDVVVTIKAEFNDGYLSAYEISKVESF